VKEKNAADKRRLRGLRTGVRERDPAQRWRGRLRQYDHRDKKTTEPPSHRDQLYSV